MIKIKLNGKRYTIPRLSELTFEQFNKIIVKNKVNSLKEYLAVLTGNTTEEIMASEFSGAQLPSLQEMIFDVNIDAVIKDKKTVVECFGIYHIVSNLGHGIFEKNYQFGLFSGLYEQKKINFNELCLYSLAIALCDNELVNLDEINKRYEFLNNKPWKDVLPQGFFLAKKLSKSKIISIRLYLSCTLQSKRIKTNLQVSKKKLIELEKN